MNYEAAIITYSTSGSDPFRAYNSAYHTARATYYGASGIPHCWCDGVLDFHPGSASNLTNAYNQRINDDCPISIDIFAAAAGDEVSVTATVNSGDEAVNGSYVLHMALVCLDWSHYNYNAGQEYGHHSLLDMSPNASGQTFAIDANSTETFTGSFEWPITLQGYEIEFDNVEVIVWVQNTTTDDVIQCQASELATDYMFTAEAEVLNSLAPVGVAQSFDIDIDNVGLQQDTYDITVSSDLPDTWSFSYTTPDGDQSGNSTLTVASMESYTSTLTITPDDVEGASGSMEITISSQTVPAMSYSFPFFVMNTPRVLVVNGDPEGNYGDFYESAIENAANINLDGNLSWGVWPVYENELTAFDLAFVSSELMIWFIGDGGNIQDTHVSGLVSYLNQGHNLWISGSASPQRIDDTVLLSMMGADYQGTYPSGVSVSGVDGDPVGDGLTLNLGGGDGADNLGVPTSMTLDGGTQCIMYSAIRRAGVRNEGETGYRTLLLGFPFEAIADEDSRNTFMLQALGWLVPAGWGDAPELGGHSTPQEFSLSQNHPNPFNPTTEIAFNLPARAEVSVTVYDVMGREVVRLANGTYTAGSHQLTFDGSHLASGVYFCRMTVTGEQSFEATRKMMLMK